MKGRKKLLIKTLSFVLAISMVLLDSYPAYAMESSYFDEVSLSSTDENEIDISDVNTDDSESDSDYVEEIIEQNDTENIGEDTDDVNPDSSDDDSDDSFDGIDEIDQEETFEENEEEQENDEEDSAEELIEDIDTEDFCYYRLLSSAEVEEKAELAKRLDEIDNYEESGYVTDEVIALCESEEEALKMAQAYSELTGYDVILKSFSYGVATFKIQGSASDNDKFSSTLSKAQRVIHYAADPTIAVPAVFANIIYESCSIKVNTDKENFNDPFLKIDDTSENPYQFYHDMIGDKYLWEAIDNGKLDATKLNNVYVAVLDSGINTSHPDLSGVVKESKSFVYGYSSAEDGNGHGTNVAGIIASKANNNVGGRGVASGVNLLNYRVFDETGSSADDSILRALNYILDEEGTYSPNVINMSLGSSYFSFPEYITINNLLSKGITVVASSGNDNSNKLTYPACLDGVINVAAVGYNYEKTTYSNYQNCVTLCAPGGDISYVQNEGIYYDMMWETGAAGAESSVTISGSPYASYCGTSQAAPVVSAAVAYLYAYNEDMSPELARLILRESTIDIEGKYKLGTGCIWMPYLLSEISVPISAPVARTAQSDSAEEIVSGTIVSGTDIYLTSSDSRDSLYYSVNNQDFDLYEENTPIKLEGKGETNLKIVALRYGKIMGRTEYNYVFDDSLVSSISIDSSTNTFDVAVGKTLQLNAFVLPEYAKNKVVDWYSEDTSIATIDSKGKVTALSEGEVNVCAKAKDGSGIEGTALIVVKPTLKQITIDSDSDFIVIKNDGETAYKFGEVDAEGNEFRIVTYPINSGDCKFTYKSDKPAIATIDADGNIKGVSSGTTKITVTAADGSGLKDTINVKVFTPVTSIAVTSSFVSKENGHSIVSEGSSITPIVSFNDGGNPDNKALRWEIIDGGSYATIDERTGKVTGKEIVNPEKSCEPIKVKASSLEDENVYTEWYIDVCQKIENVQFNGIDTKKIELPKDACIPMEELFEVVPSSSFTNLKFTSSNPKVFYISSNNEGYAVAKGKATINVEAMDGSGLKYRFEVSVTNFSWDALGMKSKDDCYVLYPGKTLSFELTGQDIPSEIKSNAWLAVLDSNGYMSPEMTFLDENGSVASKITINKLNITANKVYQAQCLDLYLGLREKISFWGISFWQYYSNFCAVKVEMYPSKTKSIDIPKEMSLNLSDKRADFIIPKSLPSDACQKYYKYSSSNPKVASVSEDGLIVAQSNGTCNITVTAGDGSKVKAVCKVTVAQQASEVVITSKTGSNELGAGKKLQLVATVDAASSDKNVIWTSSDASIATVDAKGNVTAAKTITEKHNVSITATAKNNSAVSGSFEVDIYPLTTAISAENSSITLYTEDVYNAGSQKILSKTGEVEIFVTPENVCKNMTVASSNAKVATATYDSFTGKVTITGLSAGNTNIKLTALDASGKSATIKVTVKVPVSELNISAKGNVTELLPGKNIQMVATANKGASNSKVAWSVLSGNEYATIDAKSGKLVAKPGNYDEKKTVTVLAETTDGSCVTGTVDVTINPITTSLIKVLKDTEEIKTDTLCLGTEIGSLKNRAEYSVEFYDKNGDKLSDSNRPNVTATSSNNETVAVSVEDGKVSLAKGTKAGKATVSILSADGSGKKVSISVNVIEPIRQLKVKSSTNEYNMAVGTNLQMQATTTSNATNKGITWSLSEVPTDIEDYVSINTKGQLSVNKLLSITESKTVRVNATAVDGSGTVASRQVTIYPASKAVRFSPSSIPSGVIADDKGATMNVGQRIRIKIYPDVINSYDDYYVTYKAGSGKVSYVSANEDGTIIEVIAQKKGSIAITATAQDGSKIKGTYKITVVQ